MKFGLCGRTTVLVVLVTLAGCSPLRKLTSLGGTCHDPKPYMGAKSVAPLQIPPGLDPADTGSAMKIPRLNEPAMPPRKGKDPCLDEPPPFLVKKAPVPQA